MPYKKQKFASQSNWQLCDFRMKNLKRLFLSVCAIFAAFSVSASDPRDGASPARYYGVVRPCVKEDASYQECLNHTRAGGLWFHYSIGIVLKGHRVCGISHYEEGKTDVTRFTGTIKGARAHIVFSSSHNSSETAEAILKISPNEVIWDASSGYEDGVGYQGPGHMVFPRIEKPQSNESYILNATEECREFLRTGKPFKRLAWDF